LGASHFLDIRKGQVSLTHRFNGAVKGRSWWKTVSNGLLRGKPLKICNHFSGIRQGEFH